MAIVERYAVVLHGSPTGYEGNRAFVHLTGEGGVFLGRVFFHDPGMPFPDDSASTSGSIFMQLPSSMLQVVLDTLRNEKPVDYQFINGRAWLGTLEEPVGESEP